MEFMTKLCPTDASRKLDHTHQLYRHEQRILLAFSIPGDFFNPKRTIPQIRGLHISVYT